MVIHVGILTVSDRSARGQRADLSGPALAQAIADHWPAATVAEAGVVPDERAEIAATLARWADDLRLDLILSTGGPGFAPRDVYATSEELEAGVRLRFRLERRRAASLELRLVSPPPPGVVLEACLERPDGQQRPWDFDLHRGILDADGRLRLEPAETGAFVVHLARLDGGTRHDFDLAVPVDVEAYEGTPTAIDQSGADVRVLYLPLGPAQL